MSQIYKIIRWDAILKMNNINPRPVISIKPDKNFKMTKANKRVLATFINPQERNYWKRMLIDAQLSEMQAKLTKFKEPKGE